MQVVGGNTRVEDVGTSESLASKRKVSPDRSVHSRKEERSADVGEESNCSLGHRKDSLLGRDSERSMGTQTNTTSHSDTIHESDIGLLVCRNVVVQLIFEGEVLCRLLPTVLTLRVELGERSDVTSSAKGLFTSTLHNDNVGE